MVNRRNLVNGVIATGFALVAAACGSNGPSLATAPSPVVMAGDSQVPIPSDDPASSSLGASIRVRCERRGTQRSRVSVDGRGLAAGKYSSRVTSGTSAATSGSMAAVAGEVEFDFDSNPNDVAAGATRISPTFIQGGRVRGEIRTAAGVTVVAATVSCDVR